MRTDVSPSAVPALAIEARGLISLPIQGRSFMFNSGRSPLNSIVTAKHCVYVPARRQQLNIKSPSSVSSILSPLSTFLHFKATVLFQAVQFLSWSEKEGGGGTF